MRELFRRLGVYVAVLRSPRVFPPALGVFLATLPIGILGLAVLLLVRQSSGNFTAAGAVVAIFGVGTGLGIVIQGRLLDSFGPRRVLLIASGVQSAVLVSLALVAGADGAPWLLAALAFTAGLGEPQAGPALRSMWPALVSREQRAAASALSSVLFELPVVIGPLLLAALVRFATAEAAIVAAAGLSLTGSVLVALSRAARGWEPSPARQPSLVGPLAVPGIRLVAGVVAVQGLAVGLLQVSCAAFFTLRDLPGDAGFLYALLSLGSLAGAMLYGAWSRPGKPGRQLPLLLLGFTGALAGAAFAPGAAFLAACVFVAGLFVGPISVRSFTDVERLTPPGSLATAATTLTAIGLAATSAGTALGGWLIDWADISYLTVCAALCTLSVALLSLRARSSRKTDPEPAQSGGSE